MIKIFDKEIPRFPPEERSPLRERAERAEKRFLELSEEDQMLSCLSKQLSGIDSRDDDTLLRMITRSHGPKFAKRVLGDPERRKKIGLDWPAPVIDQSVLATTVARD